VTQNHSRPKKLNTLIKFIYFDVDDTILDHRKAERLALAETYSIFTVLHKADLEDFRERYHHINVDLWQKYGLREIDRPYLEYHRFADTLKWFSIDADPVEIRNTYMNLYRAKWGWVDEAEKILTVLSIKYPIGFLTNGFSEIQRWKAEKFDLHRFGDNYVISEDVGHMKPSSEIFDFATKKAGCNPSEVLYIGDSFVSDIQGGAAFGWKTGWFNRDRSPDPEKVDVADFVFDSFIKLPELIESLGK
jgi:YjjG family noncanonical pyrimidine nucleotidase